MPGGDGGRGISSLPHNGQVEAVVRGGGRGGGGGRGEGGGRGGGGEVGGGEGSADNNSCTQQRHLLIGLSLSLSLSHTHTPSWTSLALT